MNRYFDFREQWLTAAVQEMTPRLEAAGYRVPDNMKIACGFPVGSRGGLKTIGQCISPKASASGATEMFISPVIDDPVKVLGIVLHEVGHAVVGVDAGHGPAFKTFCTRLGLEGKAREAMPGPATEAWLRDQVLPILGAYPHASVDPSQRKKQATRMIKLMCPETGYTVRTTKKWLEQGLPTSPAGYEMVPVEEGAEE